MGAQRVGASGVDPSRRLAAESSHGSFDGATWTTCVAITPSSVSGCRSTFVMTYNIEAPHPQEHAGDGTVVKLGRRQVRAASVLLAGTVRPGAAGSLIPVRRDGLSGSAPQGVG